MNFKILTFATNPKHYVLNILKSKLPIIVLDSTDFNWEGKTPALKVLEFINHLSEDDVVLCSDSYDVLPLNDCSEEKLYKKIINNFNLDKITFNAETQCFPNKELISQYPESPGKWKYLNGGIMTGLVKNIKNILNLFINSDTTTNQEFYSKLFLTTDLINLDHKCEVFQTLLNGPYPNHPNIDMNDFLIVEKTITNKYFNTQPLLFHGNGSVNLYPLLSYVKTISQ